MLLSDATWLPAESCCGKPSNTPAQWKIITRELTLVPKLKKTGTGRILDQLAEKLNHRSLIVILSDFFDDFESIKKGLRHLRYKKHEIMAFQVLDPQEIAFDFRRPMRFLDMEGGPSIFSAM